MLQGAFFRNLKILFLVTLSAFRCVAGLECLGAVMALAAILACVHVSHREGATFLHREDLGMAVIALKAFVCMRLAVKYDLACAAARELYRFSGRHCQSAAYECYDNEQCNK